jgi:hypothetical protein
MISNEATNNKNLHNTMKKLVLTIALALIMGTTAFAQQGGGALRRSKEYQENYRVTTRNQPAIPVLPSEFGSDQDSNGAPLGSGIAVLLGLGAAYMVGKRRKED